MNPYNFSLLLFAFGSFFVGLLVWMKRQDAIGKVYFLISVVISLWGVGFAVMLAQNSSYQTALFFARIGEAASIFIPPVWFHLSILISHRTNYEKHVKLFYLVAALIACFSFSPLFVSGVAPILSFKYYLRAGPVLHVFAALFFVCVPFGFVQLFRRRREIFGEERSQLGGFIIATLFGFLGGGLSFLPDYGIPVPQYGMFLMPAYPFITAYFLIRHRLFDVEQAVQAFQREKLATIGLIASSINHEIRNPLYIAKGVLDNLIEITAEGNQARNPLEVADKARFQIQRALDVITKLNRFARPTQEQEPATKASAGPPTPFGGSVEHRANISEALTNVLDLIQYEFELDKIHIENRLPQDLPPIHCDPRQLEEILFNLIVNACHAMSKNKEGGTLTISVQRPAHDMSFPRKRPACRTGRESTGSGSPTKAFGDDRETGKVTIEIADTGTGIPPEQLKHLFEPFYTTKGDKGTGLGLYITKQLIERNGGRISAKSREAVGAVFSLMFNAA